MPRLHVSRRRSFAVAQFVHLCCNVQTCSLFSFITTHTLVEKQTSCSWFYRLYICVYTGLEVLEVRWSFVTVHLVLCTHHWERSLRTLKWSSCISDVGVGPWLCFVFFFFQWLPDITRLHWLHSWWSGEYSCMFAIVFADSVQNSHVCPSSQVSWLGLPQLPGYFWLVWSPAGCSLSPVFIFLSGGLLTHLPP